MYQRNSCLMIMSFILMTSLTNLVSDLSNHKDLSVSILECFSSPSEEIKSAASFALGL